MKYFLVILVIILLSGFLVWFGIYLPKDPWPSETEVFSIKKGESAKEISISLKKQGLIRSSSLFRIYTLATARAVKLQAGEYELSSSMNVPEIVAKFASGDRLRKMITIIEGWTIKDIEKYLGAKIDPGLEGYLFPDTYEIYPEDSIEEIVAKMLANFDKKIRSRFGEDLFLGAKLPAGSLAPRNTSLASFIIMASMLEKEVKTLEDKKIVSGILWKRLEAGMPLQVDAALDTYKYQGLPPGPICNPGLESIEAAIYPELSSYWYYLSAQDGTTIFSKSLQEHNIAKARYLK